MLFEIKVLILRSDPQKSCNMYQKILSIAVFVLISLTLFGQEKANAFRDPSFAGGVKVACTDMSVDTICGVLPVDTTKTPVWTLRQYNSKFDMTKAKAEDFANKYTFSLPGNGNLNAKVVTINPARGAICLECNASAEYSGIRREGQPWIFMTVDAPTDTLLLAKYKSLKLYLDCRSIFYEDCMGFLADKKIHAATCRINFKIRNINQSGPLFGKYFTLSVVLFDNRYMGKLFEGGLRDATSSREGEFVYSPSSKLYISSPLSNYLLPKSRQGAEVNVDLLKIVKDALDAALAKGLFEETYLAEWEIVGCDYGWEMTGTYNAAYEIRGIKLAPLR